MTTTLSNTLALRASETFTSFAMAAPGQTVAVAFSGGADSIALLHLLYTRRQEYGIRVKAVHVNHMLRGEESQRDEDFCRQFCSEHGIELRVERRDVAAMVREGACGVEECARSVRYGIFEELISSGYADKIATAHHALDNLETVLMSLARGSGMRGACGIPPVRGEYIRPLITCSKAQITEYIREQGLSYVTDSTNADQAYTRNRLRAQVLPVLEGVNPALYEHVSDFCLSLREDEEYLARVAQDSKTDSIVHLRSYSLSILTRVLMLLYADVSGQSLARTHVNGLCRLVRDGSQGACISLPDRVLAYVDRGRLCFEKNTKEKKAEFCYPLLPGINEFPDLGCVIILSEKELSEDYLNIYKKSIHVSVNSDKINKMFIRSRREGDAYRSFGMTRKVKKLIQQDKLTVARRECLPLFCDDEGILWVPGHGVRDGAWADNGLHIYYGETKCGVT